MINIDLNIIAIFILIVYCLVCIIKKISLKIAFIIGVIFIVVAAGSLMLEEEDLAINITTMAYYLLIVAVALAFVEYYRDITKTKKVKKPKEMPVPKDTNKIKKKEKKSVFTERPNFCPHCGTKFDDDLKFCVECGAELM